jgi:hypothetical protein
MQIRRGCLLPHRMCCRYVKQPNRRPRSQRAALPRSRRKRQRSKRRGQLLAGRVPSESSNQIRSGAATLRPGRTVLAPGSDLAPPTLRRPTDHHIRPRWGSGKSCSRHCDPARSYASTNCRSNQAAYPAVCGKRATLRDDVDRADRKSRCRRNRPSALMLSGQVFGRGQSQYHSRILDRWAAHTDVLGGRSHSRRRSSILIAPCFAALNPFCGADRSRMGCWEGIASACSASSAGCRGWVERSETQTHPRVAA